MTLLPTPDVYVTREGDDVPLTARQLRILEIIAASLETDCRPPAIREIGRAAGIRSTNGVMDHLKALERKGCIVRESMLTRAIRITPKGRAELGMDRPGTCCPMCGKPR